MRLESKVKFTRLAKYALVVYVMLSLFYTTNHYFSAHYVNNNNNNIPSQVITKSELKPAVNPPPSVPTTFQEEVKTVVQIKPAVEGHVTWPGSKGSESSHQISEDLVRSKIFSSSMGLDNVTPYYFKASQIKNKKDITLATLVTRNRFQVLSNLATNYKGPISAAIHVLDDEEKTATIKELGKIYSSNPNMQKYVDVHLIIDKFDRQFNMWRNAAKLFTRTDYLMMLDVDFHLCTDFRKTIFGDSSIFDLLDSGKAAFVVPAFEYINQKDGNDWRTFPTTKDQVINQVDSLKLDSFHSSWVSGHGATNYSKWYTADELYPVTEYEYSYEPYVIYKKEGTPWCEERFIGYGANKAACLFEIFISGVDYYVLPNDFLIHQSHKYANHDRTRERVHNKNLYDSFRTEICLRYSRKYVIEDTWYTPVADNMKKVCTDIPKWKYLSGISKEQREKDAAEEQALREQQELEAAAAVVVDVVEESDQQDEQEPEEEEEQDIQKQFEEEEQMEKEFEKEFQEYEDSIQAQETTELSADDEEFILNDEEGLPTEDEEIQSEEEELPIEDEETQSEEEELPTEDEEAQVKEEFSLNDNEFQEDSTIDDELTLNDDESQTEELPNEEELVEEESTEEELPTEEEEELALNNEESQNEELSTEDDLSTKKEFEIPSDTEENQSEEELERQLEEEQLEQEELEEQLEDQTNEK